MARTVRNPAFVPHMNRQIRIALQARTTAMESEAKADASMKSKTWASAITSSPVTFTGVQMWTAHIGLRTSRDGFPGWLKERGTKQRTRHKSGRGPTGAMPADPVFVPLAQRWARVPFTFKL